MPGNPTWGKLDTLCIMIVQCFHSWKTTQSVMSYGVVLCKAGTASCFMTAGSSKKVQVRALIACQQCSCREYIMILD